MIGCGDIAQRVAAQLGVEHFHCAGLRRDTKRLVTGIAPLALDLNQPGDYDPALFAGYDLVLLTLTPNQRNEAGYRQAYITNLQKVLRALGSASHPPSRLLFMSSTSVYGQNAGDWVDEDSETLPREFNGKILLEAEALVANSGLEHTVIRSAGIYGPGRLRLLDQVREGQWPARDQYQYSNRIHADDCAAFIAQLAHQYRRGEQWQPLYLATDCEPVLLAEVKQWLAVELQLSVPPLPSENNKQSFTNKRCSNRRMLDSGYQFIYPTFRQGYRNLIKLP